MAGLVAAKRLSDRGLDVLVLEARERVGGRLWSHRMPNGEVVELGGEWISTSQGAVIGLANEHGLGLIDTGMDFISRDPIGGPPIAAVEHERLARLRHYRMAKIGPAGLSSMSAEEVLDSLGETGPAWSKPLGRVFLAGEHVNGTGTIDGAIRSGRRTPLLWPYRRWFSERRFSRSVTVTPRSNTPLEAGVRQLYIDGNWVDPRSAGHFETFNPATGEVLEKISSAGSEDADAAVAAARRAFDDGTWGPQSAPRTAPRSCFVLRRSSDATGTASPSWRRWTTASRWAMPFGTSRKRPICSSTTPDGRPR